MGRDTSPSRGAEGRAPARRHASTPARRHAAPPGQRQNGAAKAQTHSGALSLRQAKPHTCVCAGLPLYTGRRDLAGTQRWPYTKIRSCMWIKCHQIKTNLEESIKKPIWQSLAANRFPITKSMLVVWDSDSVSVGNPDKDTFVYVDIYLFCYVGSVRGILKIHYLAFHKLLGIKQTILSYNC